ncbi:MAG: FMN-binding protein [Clostridia bacterium]|nr:FMN-binding protein [Clostridia bacterium]
MENKNKKLLKILCLMVPAVFVVGVCAVSIAINKPELEALENDMIETSVSEKAAANNGESEVSGEIAEEISGTEKSAASDSSEAAKEESDGQSDSSKDDQTSESSKSESSKKETSDVKKAETSKAEASKSGSGESSGQTSGSTSKPSSSTENSSSQQSKPSGGGSSQSSSPSGGSSASSKPQQSTSPSSQTSTVKPSETSRQTSAVTETPKSSGTQPTQTVPEPSQTAPEPEPTPAEPTGQYIDGTYTVAVPVNFVDEDTDSLCEYDLQVKVTVQNGEISSVTAKAINDRSDEPDANTAYINKALKKISPAIIANQSNTADVVSHATYSSNAILDGVGQALAQAKR